MHSDDLDGKKAPLAVEVRVYTLRCNVGSARVMIEQMLRRHGKDQKEGKQERRWRFIIFAGP